MGICVLLVCEGVLSLWLCLFGHGSTCVEGDFFCCVFQMPSLESKNRSIVSVSTLQELGSQMMESLFFFLKH